MLTKRRLFGERVKRGGLVEEVTRLDLPDVDHSIGTATCDASPVR